MKEAIGNIWSTIGMVDALCVTTNGIVKPNGELVMGAGIALAAAKKFSSLQVILGAHIRIHGNSPCAALVTQGTAIVSFPTKNDYRYKSSIDLIKNSAWLISKMAHENNWRSIAMTRPGCGLGGLSWENDVSPIISPILDNRFTVFHV
jgi:O-acetyl-ADP-ribose deacetylase (regulator of RNase III)